MPRKTRTRRGGPFYSLDHRTYLETGFAFSEPPFGEGEYFREDEAIECWNHLRTDILLEHLSHSPCTRPWAWWHLENREPRLCLTAVRGEPEPDEEPDEEYGCSSPYANVGIRELRFESQAHYLRRYGLLLKTEREHLLSHPELLEPVEGALVHWR